MQLVVAGNYKEFTDYCIMRSRLGHDVGNLIYVESTMKLLGWNCYLDVVWYGTYHDRPDIRDILARVQSHNISYPRDEFRHLIREAIHGR